MDKIQAQKTLKPERQKTDQSLTEEREKTDASINKAVEKTEMLTDIVVNGQKLNIDDAASTPQNLQRAISKIDQAIGQERDSKKDLVDHLLGQEREKTDADLHKERVITDGVVGKTANLLSDEIADHEETKNALTTQDEFRAIVSHDLRNPIGIITSTVNFLLNDAQFNDLNADVKHWIELIKRNADAAVRLISDILDMERVAEGKLVLDLAPHSIDKIIHEAIERFIHEADTKGVELRLVSADIHENIVCDKDRILQILSNLINNAIKFTPKGGTVTLNTKRNGEEIQISLQDSGPGIPKDKQKHIFDRFAQIRNKDRSGLGLGLYIARMFTQAHGGKIWLQSHNGEGSTFFLTLPIHSHPLVH